MMRFNVMTSSRIYSLAHLTVPGMAPLDMIDAASRCGFSHVGFRFTPVTPGGWAFPMHEDAALLRATKTRLNATGMGVLDIELARLAPDTNVRDFEPMFAAAKELGARHILTQIHDDDRERGASHFVEICDLAARYGLCVDLEFLPWTQNRSLATAAAYVALANRTNAGIAVDTLHFARSGSNPDDMLAMPCHWFKYAQICDAPAECPTTVEELIHTAREARLDPGEGGLDLLGMLRRLPPDIPLSLEVPNTERARSLSVDVRLKRMMAATRALVAKLEMADSPRDEDYHLGAHA
jgi:sugar phosphate isomerase/epimerase